MNGQPPRSIPPASTSVSYFRLMLEIGSVLAALVAIAVMIARQQGSKTPAPANISAAAPAVVVAPSAPPVPPKPEVAPAPVVKELDRRAVAQAEAALDAASRDRARAEARLAEAQRLLAAAGVEAEAAVASSRKLAYRVRDPSAQIARVSAQGGFLKAERDRLKDEVAALKRAPRPKVKSLIDRNPVSKPSSGDEFHFEIRHNRVASIDLQRLLNLVKSDAQLRTRLAENARVVESHVGPVGSFSMDYVLRRTAVLVDDLLERRGLRWDLAGWEIIPEYEGRGEPYESTRQPFSEFARAINRLNNEHATITMWVYPDGFPLYRKLRDDLHARGFIVAARPLPEGMSIKGSPAGSLSAAQ
jgi:hypothetical protein